MQHSKSTKQDYQQICFRRLRGTGIGQGMWVVAIDSPRLTISRTMACFSSIGEILLFMPPFPFPGA